MTIPALILGIVLSTLYGAIFHLWRGGGINRLFLYLFLGWAGFWGGQLLASSAGWTFDKLGPLHVGTATVASLLALGIGYWLSQIEVTRQN